jgi:NRPS condensation-like uncharacterized protein
MKENRFFPASPVDELAYLAEVSTPYSLTFGAGMTLEGEINSDIVCEALDATLNCYPKLKCILVKDYPSVRHWFRYCWYYQNISSKDILEEVEDSSPEGTDKDVLSYVRHYYPSHTIDITRETPFRVMLIRNARCVHLLFFIHHAAADGISFIVLAQYLIKSYEDIFYQRKKKVQVIPDVEAISQPDISFRWNHFSPKIISPLIRHITLAKKEPPVQVYPQDEDGGVKKFIAAAKELSPQQFNHMRTSAKNHQTTINSYLLAAIFQTIKQWNYTWQTTAGRIYLSVPVNLRSPGEHTVGNLISQFYLSYRSELIDDKDTTLRMIQEKRSFLIEHARQHVNLTWFLKPIPLQLKMLMFKQRTQTNGSTLILSNMGTCHLNPHHTDEEGFHYMGPARVCSIHCIASPVPWPQVDIMTYNGRMSINLSVLRSRFSSEDAEKFLNSFIQELMEPKC